jgi:hypothetical protein
MILQSFGVGLLFLFVLINASWMLTAASVLLYTSLIFAVISLVTYGI